MVLIENGQNKITFDEEMKKLIIDIVEMTVNNNKFKHNWEIGVFLVDDEKIRDINREYRSIDKATDVLSFPILDIHEGIMGEQIGDYDFEKDLFLLGDVIVSLERARKQAVEYGHSFERELAFLLSHGVLHLLGYDHGTKQQEEVMLSKQEQVLKRKNLVRE